MPVSSQTRSATTPRRSNAKPARSKPSSSKEIPNTFQFQLELNETHRDGPERIQPVNMILKNAPERYVPYPEHVAFAFGYPPHPSLVGYKPPSRFPPGTSVVFERAQKQNTSPQFGLPLSDCLLLGVHKNNVDIRLPDWPVFSQDYVRNLKEPKVFWELVVSPKLDYLLILTRSFVSEYIVARVSSHQVVRTNSYPRPKRILDAPGVGLYHC